jgi:AP2-associated kinase
LFPPAGQSSKPRSAPSSPLISPSVSTDSTRADLSPSMRSSPRHRKQSTNGRDAGPPPSASTGSAAARPRPQSMFLNLNSPTAAAVKFPMVSPVDDNSTGLEVPSPEPRTQRTTRRTSISDMVQRYEAMSGSAAPSPASRQPVSAAQPGPAVSLSRSATTHVSPSPRRTQLGAVGLPGLAADPPKKPPTGLGASDKPRAEYASPVGLPGLAVERKPSASYGGRRSPTKFDASVGGGGSGGLDLPVRPVPRRSFSPPVGEEPQASSPERPYQGVGRLIDEWQRKTADAESPPSPASRRRGGGGGGMGATASPRRAGVVAGRGGQD